MYHSIDAGQLPAFKRQVERMRGIGRIIPLEQLDFSPEGEKTFAITFDDGFRSTAEVGLSFLKKIGVPSTIFLPSGSLGKGPQWVTDTDHRYYHETIIDEEALKKISPSPGIVQVGSHCVTHKRLTHMPREEVRRELEDSKQYLEKIMEKPVRFLAFPHGDFDDNTLSLSKSLGYEKVFAGEPVPNDHPQSGFLFGRIDISPQDWPVESWLKFQGAYDWLPFAIVLKSKIRSWIS